MAAVRAAAAAEDADPGLGHGFHAAGEALRRAVVHRLAVHDLRDAGIGLGDQGNTSNFMQPLQLRQHFLRTNGAVQAKGVDPHALHHLQGSHHIAAGEGAALGVAGEGDEHRLAADALHRQQRRTGLCQGHHGLDHKEIHPGVFQSRRLLGVDFQQFCKAGRPQGIEQQPGGGNIPRHPGPVPGGLAAQAYQSLVVFLHLAKEAMLLQLHPVCTKGGGIDHPAARRNVGPLNLQNRIGMLQYPALGTFLAGIAPLLQLCSGGAVQYQGKAQFHSSSSSSQNIMCWGKARLKRLSPDSSIYLHCF